MLSDTFLKHFETLEDPRIDNHNKRHELSDIFVITILASICGADNWVEICRFAKAKQDFLVKFLKLPNGIPSHDTFGRVFSLINSKEFEKCFFSWIKSIPFKIDKEIIAIDGKTLRGSRNSSKGLKPLHLVSAWASRSKLMLAQVKTKEKSNEIEAIPRLLDLIEVENSIITIDAMGCQKNISKQIVSKNADYVLSLKENQKNLHNDVSSIFTIAEVTQFKDMLNCRKLEKVRDHGRIETRRYSLISARDPLPFALRWPGLKSIGMLEVRRTVNHEVTRSKRFFLTSLNYNNIDDFMIAVRRHWSIEINLHWSLDVSFKEDINRTRVGYAAENLSYIRRIALMLVKRQRTNKSGGIACIRKAAGWDNNYLMKILNGGAEMKMPLA